jgi:hypothetical protein
MADNRDRNEEMDRKLGGSREDEGFGQQSPGRNPADDQSTGNRGGKNTESRIGEDEDSDSGAGRAGGQRKEE